MSLPRRSACLSIVLSAATLSLAGCAMSDLSAPSAPATSRPVISGHVHGGQQPVSGATIQLYAANTTTAKGPSTPLLTVTVTSQPDGSFTITGDYTCPSSGALVYLVATGGNPGLGGTVNNSQLAMMTALGACGSLTSSTFVTINELTTVAAVEALAPFMADFADIGAPSTNSTGLVGAFSTAVQFVNPATGNFPTVSTSITLPTQLLNTLADILSACINTSGGAAGSANACGTLLGQAGTGGNANTIAAILQVALTPWLNVSNLFALVNPSGPFQPTLTTVPGSFAVPYGIALPVPAGVINCAASGFLMAIDTAQNVWVYTTGATYNVSTSACVNATGPITVYDTNGNLLQTITAGTGGLTLPLQMAADPSGNVWTLNGNFTLSKFGPNGGAISPAGGFPSPFTNTTGFTAPIVLNLMTFDPSGNLWVIGPGTTSNCFVEVNSSGSIITPAGNFCSTAANTETILAQADGSGNVWYMGTNTIADVNSSGNLVSTGVNTNGCFMVPPTGSAAPLKDEFTYRLAYDRLNNHLWGASILGVGVLNANGTQAFCDPNNTNLPMSYTVTTVPGVSSNTTIGSLESMAVDGAGNLWFIAALGISNTTVSPPTVYSASYIGLHELDPNGNLLTPFNLAQGVYGLQPISFSALNILTPLAIDGYGNIWTINADALVKIPGLAVPKTYQ